MRKFFGKFVSVTLAAVVIAMFALSSDDKWCSRVDKAFDESALGSFLNESKAGYGRYATGLPGQAASVLAQAGVGHRQYLRGDIRVQAIDLRVLDKRLLTGEYDFSSRCRTLRSGM